MAYRLDTWTGKRYYVTDSFLKANQRINNGFVYAKNISGKKLTRDYETNRPDYNYSFGFVRGKIVKHGVYNGNVNDSVFSVNPKTSSGRIKKWFYKGKENIGKYGFFNWL